MTERRAILIADDHAVVRSGLRLLLDSQDDMHVVAECGSHREILAALERLGNGVDVVTLDLTMPGGSPVALIEDIRRLHPQVRVVVLTMHDDAAHARLALAAGASGYVVKSAADTDLLTAIRTAAAGGIHCTVVGERGKAVPAGVRAAGPGSAVLSDREREVLALLAQGHTNQAVADRLYVSVKTVESYRARLMAKLGLKGRAEMTRYAVEAGLLGGSGTEPAPPG